MQQRKTSHFLRRDLYSADQVSERICWQKTSIKITVKKLLLANP
jgi:hypothetical protein